MYVNQGYSRINSWNKVISPKQFYNSLRKNGVDFFTGVPDSLLKHICAYITDNCSPDKNIISANEGGSIGLAIGYYLSTNKIPLVYMQNSGFGNALNPLLSLADNKVYGIPMILLVGWRGEPGIKDEPQHIKQGEVSETLLKTLKLPYKILSSDSKYFDKNISESISIAKSKNTPFIFLVKKNTFNSYTLKNSIKTNYDLSREDAIINSLSLINHKDIIVSTTGKTSRELFEYRSSLNLGHHRDFLTVGGMGHANQIALGISLIKKKRKIFCFDGDGAVLMHSGSISIIGSLKPKNFKHIVLNNGSHDSVGGQPTVGYEIDLSKVFKGFNYKNYFKISNKEDFNKVFLDFINSDGPSIIEILTNKGSRKDLGRPTKTPSENKFDFISFLND